MFEGYLELGGGEVLNSARAVGYATTAPCPVTWLQCPPCDGIRDVLGDDAYTYANIIDAPWYDAEEESTHRFLGAHALTIEGLPDSTREADTAEAILDGGVVGRVRRATRRMRVRAVLSAQGEDALETGFNWLSSALSPGKCSTHADACGAADMQLFTACPPERSEITMPEVFWNDPITNLATNPSMETAGTAVAVRTNLATNPSFEQATAATVEVRRNLAANPRPTTGWTVNPGTGGTAAVTYGTGDATAPGGLYARTTWSVSSTASGPERGPERADVVGGPLPIGKFTTSVLVRPSAAQKFVLNISGPNSTYDSVPIIDCPANVWTRVYVTFTTTTSAALQLRVYATTGGHVWQAGETVDVAGILVEQSPILGTYFDGATLPAGDFTHAWTGTANGSASVQYGTAVPGVSGNAANTAGFKSTEWAASGAQSLRIRRTASGDAYSSIYLTPTPGKTYTAMVTTRVTTPWTSTSRVSRVQGSGGVPLGDFWTTGTVLNGVQQWRVTFDYPAGQTGMNVILRPKDPEIGVGSDIWYDDLLIVEGTYTGPYFDGSTPAKVRRNLMPNPTGAVNAAGWSANVGAVTTTRSATESRPGALTAGSVIYTVASGTGTFDMQWWDGTVAILPKVSAGQTVTFSAWVKRSTVGSFNPKIRWRDEALTEVGVATGGGTITPGVDEWIRVSVTAVVPAGATRAHPGIGVGTVAPGLMTYVDDALLEVSGTADPYFDGAAPIAPYAAAWEGTANASPSYLTDPDFTYAWSGTANASTSTQSAPTVATFLKESPPGAAVAIQSPQWASNRSKSVRVINLSSTTNYVYSNMPVEVGKTYTVIVKSRTPSAATVNTQVALAVWVGGGTTIDAPGNISSVFTGVQEWRRTFTVLTGGGYIRLRLPAHGTIGESLWFDDYLLVEGDYGGTYFDGSFPDSTADEMATVGKSVAEYEWTGTADASTSTYRTGSVVAVEDPVAYEAAVEKLVRNLHTVTCVSGPIVEQKLHRGDTWGYIVEFVLVAAVPWMFGVTKPVALTPSLPIVVQDVPFNLVPYPSAELESGTVVAATNYVTNPSIEVDATGWTVGGDAPVNTSGAIVGSRSTALAASGGLASFQVRFTATAGGAGGSMYADGTFALPAGVGRRVSIGIWMNAMVTSGTGVMGQVGATIQWINAAGAVIGSDSIPLSAPNVGPVSIKSRPVPDAANRVRLLPYAVPTSWAAGAVLDLYVDAVTVSVP